MVAKPKTGRERTGILSAGLSTSDLGRSLPVEERLPSIGNRRFGPSSTCIAFS